MILKQDVNGGILEVQCDLCKMVCDDSDEINEFILFDYKMGDISLYPNFEVKFDICQDCFTEKFPEIFGENTFTDNDTTEEVVSPAEEEWSV